MMREERGLWRGRSGTCRANGYITIHFVLISLLKDWYCGCGRENLLKNVLFVYVFSFQFSILSFEFSRPIYATN